MQTRSAVILGATGLVGGHLLQKILARPEYHQVTIFSRRPLAQSHKKLKAITTTFEDLEPCRKYLQVDDIFCCLGTTIKKAGSKAAFKAVDYHLPIAFGNMAKDQGAKHMLCVTSISSDPHSKIFYLKVKGQLERDLSAVGLTATSFFQPSFLMGQRAESRPGEAIGISIAKAISIGLIGPFKKYRPIEAADVAEGMLIWATQAPQGTHHFTKKEIEKLTKAGH